MDLVMPSMVGADMGRFPDDGSGDVTATRKDVRTGFNCVARLSSVNLGEVTTSLGNGEGFVSR
jgi:hypothetical protein